MAAGLAVCAADSLVAGELFTYTNLERSYVEVNNESYKEIDQFSIFCYDKKCICSVRITFSTALSLAIIGNIHLWEMCSRNASVLKFGLPVEARLLCEYTEMYWTLKL